MDGQMDGWMHACMHGWMDQHPFPLLHPKGDALSWGGQGEQGHMWDPCRAAQPGGPLSTPRCAPMQAGSVGSPGAAATLVEQRLPKERRFLQSEGLRAAGVCEPCRH